MKDASLADVLWGPRGDVGVAKVGEARAAVAALGLSCRRGARGRLEATLADRSSAFAEGWMHQESLRTAANQRCARAGSTGRSEAAAGSSSHASSIWHFRMTPGGLVQELGPRQTSGQLLNLLPARERHGVDQPGDAGLKSCEAPRPRLRRGGHAGLGKGAWAIGYVPASLRPDARASPHGTIHGAFFVGRVGEQRDSAAASDAVVVDFWPGPHRRQGGAVAVLLERLLAVRGRPFPAPPCVVQVRKAAREAHGGRLGPGHKEQLEQLLDELDDFDPEDGDGAALAERLGAARADLEELSDARGRRDDKRDGLVVVPLADGLRGLEGRLRALQAAPRRWRSALLHSNTMDFAVQLLAMLHRPEGVDEGDRAVLVAAIQSQLPVARGEGTEAEKAFRKLLSDARLGDRLLDGAVDAKIEEAALRACADWERTHLGTAAVRVREVISRRRQDSKEALAGAVDAMERTAPPSGDASRPQWQRCMDKVRDYQKHREAARCRALLKERLRVAGVSTELVGDDAAVWQLLIGNVTAEKWQGDRDLACCCKTHNHPVYQAINEELHTWDPCQTSQQRDKNETDAARQEAHRLSDAAANVRETCATAGLRDMRFVERLEAIEGDKERAELARTVQHRLDAVARDAPKKPEALQPCKDSIDAYSKILRASVCRRRIRDHLGETAAAEDAALVLELYKAGRPATWLAECARHVHEKEYERQEQLVVRSVSAGMSSGALVSVEHDTAMAKKLRTGLCRVAEAADLPPFPLGDELALRFLATRSGEGTASIRHNAINLLNFMRDATHVSAVLKDLDDPVHWCRSEPKYLESRLGKFVEASRNLGGRPELHSLREAMLYAAAPDPTSLARSWIVFARWLATTDEGKRIRAEAHSVLGWAGESDEHVVVEALWIVCGLNPVELFPRVRSWDGTMERLWRGFVSVTRSLRRALPAFVAEDPTKSLMGAAGVGGLLMSGLATGIIAAGTAGAVVGAAGAAAGAAGRIARPALNWAAGIVNRKEAAAAEVSRSSSGHTYEISSWQGAWTAATESWEKEKSTERFDALVARSGPPSDLQSWLEA